MRDAPGKTAERFQLLRLMKPLARLLQRCLGLVRLRGRRRSPGRPVTYGTTDHFLEHFGLASLHDLPGAAEMRAAGLLDLSLPADFSAPDPTRTASDEEDPIEDEDDAPEFAQDFMGEER